MYQIKATDFELITDMPWWIKRQNNGYFQRCDNQEEALGIIIRGLPYAFSNTINEMPEAIGVVQANKVDGGELILNNQATTSIVFTTIAEKGDLDDVTITEHSDEFEGWVSNKAYAAGAIRRYGDKLYRCVQAHTSQDDWTPDTAVSLWTPIGNPNEEFPQWAQPVGAHDAYQLGDKVTHNDIKYISNVANNVWEPGVHGWDIYVEE